MLKTKKCSRCKEVKTVEDFHKQKSLKYGVRYRCKECTKKYSKEYYKNNKEKSNKNGREYYKNNTEKLYKAHKIWAKNNPEKIKEIRKRGSERRKSNPMLKLNNLISSFIRQSLKNNKNGKSGKHWEDLVGFTLQDLITHLESLFKPGMTWENNSRIGWQIDHIQPISSFNYTSYNDPEFKKCWDINNLQPLWAIENIKKSNKML